MIFEITKYGPVYLYLTSMEPDSRIGIRILVGVSSISKLHQGKKIIGRTFCTPPFHSYSTIISQEHFFPRKKRLIPPLEAGTEMVPRIKFQ